MGNWSKNNMAHRRTFLTLRILNQTKKQFDDAATQTMGQLAFTVPGDSSAMRREKARALASTMNNVFVDAFKTTLESDVTKTKAINSMVDVLVVPTATVEQLADAADVCYEFLGEDA